MFVTVSPFCPSLMFKGKVSRVNTINLCSLHIILFCNFPQPWEVYKMTKTVAYWDNPLVMKK